MIRRVGNKLRHLARYYLLGGRRRQREDDERRRLVARLDAEALVRAEQLDPIELARPSDSDVRVNFLCGHRHLGLCVWALWSFARSGGARLPAVVHSDGTLTPDDAARLTRHFPNIRIVHRGEFDEAFERQWGGDGGAFDRIAAFRRSHVLGPKLVDPHLDPDARVVVLLDTDLLFFREPAELLDRIRRSHDEPALTATVDKRPAYVASAEELGRRLGMRIVDRVNTGIVATRRFDRDDFELIERALAAYDEAWRRSHVAEQTLYAIVASQRGWAPLSNAYRFGTGDLSTAVCAHYPSGIRPAFYIHGLPRLLGEAPGSPLTPAGRAL